MLFAETQFCFIGGLGRCRQIRGLPQVQVQVHQPIKQLLPLASLLEATD